MPHFIVDCSESILATFNEQHINQQLHSVAVESGLFTEADIKVRVNPYRQYLVGGKVHDFIHVFAHIMQGRSTAQKAALSRAFVTKLSQMYPGIENIAMNISDFEKASYCNRKSLP